MQKAKAIFHTGLEGSRPQHPNVHQPQKPRALTLKAQQLQESAARSYKNLSV
jgi:hypothetical protein